MDLPSPSDQPLLSAILIVKNEELRLARALKPLREAGCEIVVTDTGSTDRTVAIAEEFGARIFHFPWNGDEAAARNISLQNARGSWVFWVDADEIADDDLVQSIRHDLPRIHQDQGIQTVSVVMRNIYQGGSTSLTPMMRIARRRPDLKFEGQIHPQLNFRPQIGELKGILLHEGYQWTPESRKRKAAHMRAHLEPLCKGEKPPFNRWCELLSVLLIGDATADFWSYWKKKEHYSEEEKYRGPHAHYWQDNTTNALLFFSRHGFVEEGLSLAKELVAHYPDQMAPHFFLLQQSVKLRQWNDVLEKAKLLENLFSKPPQFYNTFYPEIHGEPTRLWKMLALNHLEIEKIIDWSEFSHPRHTVNWIYSLIHFPERQKAKNKWIEAFLRLLQERKSGGKNASSLRVSLEKLLPQFVEGTVERCAAELLLLVLISESPLSSNEVLEAMGKLIHQYPDFLWLGEGLQKMEPGKSMDLEWFYEDGLHLV